MRIEVFLGILEQSFDFSTGGGGYPQIIACYPQGDGYLAGNTTRQLQPNVDAKKTGLGVFMWIIPKLRIAKCDWRPKSEISNAPGCVHTIFGCDLFQQDVQFIEVLIQSLHPFLEARS
jgi:hypothetical protein